MIWRVCFLLLLATITTGESRGGAEKDGQQCSAERVSERNNLECSDEGERKRVPTAGFFTGASPGHATRFPVRTSEELSGTTLACSSLQFSAEFSTLLSDDLVFHNVLRAPVNDRQVWINANGAILSFVNVANTEHGTWIVGADAGIDSGYLFLRPTLPSLVPGGGANWQSNAPESDGMWHTVPDGMHTITSS
jgi:hypothetical protein